MGLKKLIKAEKEDITENIIKGHKIVLYNNCVYILLQLQEWIIDWYHQYLVHLGITRMEETIKQIFYWKNVQTQIEEYACTCYIC